MQIAKKTIYDSLKLKSAKTAQDLLSFGPAPYSLDRIVRLTGDARHAKLLNPTS
jgi:hypothetical protein